VPDFTTTTGLSKIIHECSLMNAMQHFFEFVCQTDCGISKVRLEGESKDWHDLKDAVLRLKDYGLEWWVDSIAEIIQNIIYTYDNDTKNLRGRARKKFWKHIFKYYYGGGSGVNPSIDGWIVNFIPYID